MEEKLRTLFTSLGSAAPSVDRSPLLTELRDTLHQLLSLTESSSSSLLPLSSLQQSLVYEELWFLITRIFCTDWYPWKKNHEDIPGMMMTLSSSSPPPSFSSTDDRSTIVSPFGITYPILSSMSSVSLPTDGMRTDGITLLYYLTTLLSKKNDEITTTTATTTPASSLSFVQTILLPSPLYWELLYKGLYTSHRNSQRRKTCLTILQSSMRILHRYQSQDNSSYSPALYTSWDTFFVLYNALEDFPMHLLEDIWSTRIKYLFPDNSTEVITCFYQQIDDNPSTVSFSSATPTLSPSSAYLPSYYASVPVPTYLSSPSSSSEASICTVIPPEWACLIIDRAFYHDSPIVKRNILIHLMELPLEYSKAIYSLADTLIGLLQNNIQSSSDTENISSLSRHAVELPTLTGSSVDNNGKPLLTNPLFSPEIPSIASYSSVASPGDCRDGSSMFHEAIEFTNRHVKEKKNVTNPLLPSSFVSSIVSSNITFKHCQGLRLPSWYISNVMGKHFTAPLEDIALFAGGIEVLGRNVYDFLFTYGLCILQGKIKGRVGTTILSPFEHVQLWMRTLIEGGDYAIGNNRVVAKWVYRVLITLGTIVQQIRNDSSAKLHALTPLTLSHLRSQLTMISVTSTRTFNETFYRLSLDLLCSLSDPLHLPIEDICHSLSMYPALHILRIYENTYLNKNSKVLQWIIGTDPESSMVQERIRILNQRIRYAIDKYLNNGEKEITNIHDNTVGSNSRLPLSAAGIGRMVIFTQQAIEYYIRTYPSQVVSLPKDYEKQNLQGMLESLIDTLSTIHSHVYMNETKRYRSVLLSFSILGATWPAGSLGDMYLGPHIKGACVPVQIPDINNELHNEWVSVLRSFITYYPSNITLSADNKTEENVSDSLPILPFEMEEEFHQTNVTNDKDGIDMLQTAVQDFHKVHIGGNRLDMKNEINVQRNIREIFHSPNVSSELSSFVLSCINSGIHGSTTTEKKPIISTSSFSLAFLYTLRRIIPHNTHYESVADTLMDNATDTVFQSTDINDSKNEAEDETGMKPILWIRTMSILAILAPMKLDKVIGLARWNGNGSLLLETLLDFSVKKPKGFNPEKIGGFSWSTIYGFVDGCKWLLMIAILRRYTLGSQYSDTVPLFDALSENTLTKVIEAAIDSMDYINHQVMYSIIDTIGYLIRVVISSNDQAEPYEQVKNAYGASLIIDGHSSKAISKNPVLLSSTTLENIFLVFERKLADKKLSKRFVLSYAVNIMQPCLWLRPYLHLPQNCTINSNGSTQYESKNNNAGILVNHIQKVFDIFSFDRRPIFCMQIFASRLISIWRLLIELADGSCTYFASDNNAVYDNINIEDIQRQAKAILLSNLSLMQHFLLFRENRGFQEDSATNDYDARAQFCNWYNGQKSSEIDYSISQNTTIAKSMIDFELAQRGSGSISRIQMLCFIDLIARNAFSLNNKSKTSELLCCALIGRFARLANSKVFNAKPGTEVNPGTVAHMIRLRAYQAICIITRYFGKGYNTFPNSVTDYYSKIDMCTVGSNTIDRDTVFKTVEEEASTLLSQLPSWIQNEEILSPRLGHPVAQKRDTKSNKIEFLTVSEAFYSDYTIQKFSMAGIMYALIKATIFSQLAIPLPPSLRHYMEVLCTTFLRRFPFLGTKILLSLLQISEIHGQLALSSNLIAGDLILHLTRVLYDQAYNQLHKQPLWIDNSHIITMLQGITHELVVHIYPWMMNPTGLIRVISQATFLSVVPILYGEPSTISSSLSVTKNENDTTIPPLLPHSAGISEWVWPMYTSMISSNHMRGMAYKQLRNFRRIDPTLSGTIEALLSSPATEHGEILPIDAIGCFRIAFQLMTKELHGEQNLQLENEDHLYSRVEASIQSGLVPSLARYDPSYRANFGLPDEEGGLGYFGMNTKWIKGEERSIRTNEIIEDIQNNQSTSVSIINFQRKIIVENEPNDNPTNIDKRKQNGNNEDNIGDLSYKDHDSDAVAMLEATAAQKGAGLLSDLSPLLTGISIPDGRRYQPLIVVASYVSRVPNLAGLARTCEIFGIQSLVVPDKEVTKDPAFRSISVTASDWMSVHECKPDYVIDFIRARKYQGYHIIALEQAARSVRLGTTECVLPEKSVLVLGAEKEGVPIDVLNEVDIVVEIPQFGILRSLNVHVSGSLLIWEYTRQRMAKLSSQTTSSSAQ